MAAQRYCEDCLKKYHCEYKPTEGTLLRCLDKQTAPDAGSEDAYAQATSDS